jgi:uncharacterized protein
MHFARMLRKAGLPVGPGAVVDALEAVQSGALASRQDFYWALHAVFVKRHEHDPLFEQAFQVFWRNPKMAERLMHQLLQQVRVPAAAPPEAARPAPPRRSHVCAASDKSRQAPAQNLELEAQFTASRDEVLRRKDFEQMTAEEEARARAAIAALRLRRTEVRTRRFEPFAHGASIDMRRTIAGSMRRGGHLVDLARRRRRRASRRSWSSPTSPARCRTIRACSCTSCTPDERPRPGAHLPVRHPAHQRHPRDQARRDVDEAMAKVAHAVQDWSGGTRIGQCLRSSISAGRAACWRKGRTCC